MECLWSVIETARKLGISPHTLRTWVSQRKIKHLKIGRRVLFAPADVEELIQSSSVEPRSYVSGSKP